ncbi:MAG: TIGR01777 family oxidoreductase, partial [Chitinophagales bacterium]
ADCIVHLAGAGIADKRWTASRKKEIVESRTKSTALLIDKLKELNHKPELFLSISAIGYYGACGDEWVDENSPAANDFLAQVCEKWEAAAHEVKKLNINYNTIRIGMVLSPNGGALREIEKPLKFGIAGYLGNGQQYMSWIHIEDLCRQFLHCIEGKAQTNETYNAVAPNPERNIDFTSKLSKAIGKGILMPTPGFAIKLMLGEMANMVLTGQRVSCKKIQSTGFEYKYPDLKTALEDIYSKN